MNIAVIGSGAIGGLVAGYLKAKGADVRLVGHSDSVKAISENGLTISGVRGDIRVTPEIAERLDRKAELVILATKTQDIEKAIKDNLEFIRKSLILTTQNGIQADSIAGRYLPAGNIISSIVMFGATYLEPGKIVHNFEGDWVLGGIFAESATNIGKVRDALKEVFSVVTTDKLSGMKYLKIFVNANNCIPAILGKCMQVVFADTEVSKISVAIWKEGLKVINNAKIELAPLPGFPIEKVTGLAALPLEEAAKIFSGVMANLSKEPVYGSVLQSIKRGRSSEIDYINGEFVNLAKRSSSRAFLNERLVQMVHDVEKTKRFFTRKELLQNTEGLVV